MSFFHTEERCRTPERPFFPSQSMRKWNSRIKNCPPTGLPGFNSYISIDSHPPEIKNIPFLKKENRKER